MLSDETTQKTFSEKIMTFTDDQPSETTKMTTTQKIVPEKKIESSTFVPTTIEPSTLKKNGLLTSAENSKQIIFESTKTWKDEPSSTSTSASITSTTTASSTKTG